MGLASEIVSGVGSKVRALVKPTTISKENALCVNISGASQKIYVPVGPAVSGEIIDVSLKTTVGSEQMAVDGSVTPVTFRIEADPIKDIILTELLFYAIDNSIRIEGFLGQASPLTNGVILTIRSDGVESSFRTIEKTSDFELFSTLGGYTRFNETGGNSLKAIRQFPPAFPIRRFGTFNNVNDFVQVTIQDNLNSVTSFLSFVRGFKIEAGAL